MDHITPAMPTKFFSTHDALALTMVAKYGPSVSQTIRLYLETAEDVVTRRVGEILLRGCVAGSDRAADVRLADQFYKSFHGTALPKKEVHAQPVVSPPTVLRAVKRRHAAVTAY